MSSLTSVAEILQLAGAQYIAVPPTLLKALAAEPYNPATFVNTSLFDVLFDVTIPSPDDFSGLLDDDDDSAFNALVEAEDDGKLQQVWTTFLNYGEEDGANGHRDSTYSRRCKRG